MANKRTFGREGCIHWTLDTTAVIELGNAGDDTVCQWAIQVVPTGSGGSFIPKQRVIGSGLSGGNLATCVYYESDGETAIAAGAATSGAGIYYIPADGVDTFLDYTADTGSMDVYAFKFKG